MYALKKTSKFGVKHCMDCLECRFTRNIWVNYLTVFKIFEK